MIRMERLCWLSNGLTLSSSFADLEPHANFKAIWAPYLRYLERPNTGQNQIYPGSAIGGLYFTSDIHGPCLRSSPKVTLDMEIDGAGVKILLVELSTLLI